MLSSTQQFIDALEAQNLKYQNHGTSEAGREVIAVAFNGENMETVRVLFFFDADGESVSLRVFNIAKVPEDKAGAFLSAINEQNSRYRFAKFALDTDDNTLSAELDASFRDGTAGAICMEMLSRMIDICDSAYPAFMKALWA